MLLRSTRRARVRLCFESGCDNPSERVNHQYCARDLKIGLDSLSTSTHTKAIHKFCVDGIERHIRNVQNYCSLNAISTSLNICIFFRLPCCGLYRSRREKKILYILKGDAIVFPHPI